MDEDAQSKVEDCRMQASVLHPDNVTGAKWFNDTADLIERLARENEGGALAIAKLQQYGREANQRIEELGTANNAMIKLRNEEKARAKHAERQLEEALRWMERPGTDNDSIVEAVRIRGME